MVESLASVGHPQYEVPFGAFIPASYALIAQRHMHVYGTRREQMASVAVTTRAHALLHPNAHMKTPLTLEQRNYARTAESSARALLSIVDELLDATIAERQNMDVSEEPFDLVPDGQRQEE